MGCICSKESADEPVVYDEKEKAKQQAESNKTSVQLVAPSTGEEVGKLLGNNNRTSKNNYNNEESVQDSSRSKKQQSAVSAPPPDQAMSNSAVVESHDEKNRIIERPKDGHRRRFSTDLGGVQQQQTMSRILSMPYGAKGEQAAAGWPSWLSSVAGEAIQGWIPRSAESFQKLDKIGQGTYSSVFRAKDLTNNKIVAMKKVRFVNMDPESVRFMAREILILRRLDHPNVMKLEALVTSRISGSLYLVFEYMEHDLAGLAATHGSKFTEPQIKCYMQQLFRGLEHCHNRGILHRDIKGSNLLVDNNGILKIADFGLATFFQPNQEEPLTSRVVTLWYRAPELLLGATQYGVPIDMWSAGCILAELFFGKPIMPGRTEVEQMHKIFKLCGSPSEEYWQKSKLPHATSFKPQSPYRRCVADTFKDFPSSALALLEVLLSVEPEKRGTASSALRSEFFTKKPLACDPSSLPKYSPSKEFDAKLRDEEERRLKAESVKGGKDGSTKEMPKQQTGVRMRDGNAQGQGQSNKSVSVRYNMMEESGAGFPIEPPRGNKNGYSHSNSMVHPNAMGYIRTKKDEHVGGSMTGSMSGTYGPSRHDRSMMNKQTSGNPRDTADAGSTNNDIMLRKEATGYVQKRIHCSGPLMPPGGNMEDMLKEHERQIQEAVRKARLEKERTKKNLYDYEQANSIRQANFGYR
ncbi:OLC1v1018453C1 [Oldenlandia corymbosa var. corymbosa]|uniref:OLC1v1018453C1 n=1 Tax=Oldenlandia corymbosa var. corymbosa TaxID=529605 RepID=A0AAV1EBS9_OLDCO|nr:OLC1v1018453C1 [Oldenlandia corymbosa var. corymbosa]